MNESTKELIASFAKSNKIGREKLERLVEQILEMEKPAEVEAPVRGGRKTTDESLRIRKEIQALQDSLKGRLFTSKELAQELNADPMYVTNNLRWLADNMKIVKVVGKKDREQGGRGRKENIWSIAQ